ncbi:hypothetical protein U9M48_005507 [Paspalum notatum var. saurae]|uniref:Uncharacterized protein n=1 Tax=Paspalum notatum var. saurae TaxID=547442 RepID=A0AAQ3PX29_PASNO
MPPLWVLLAQPDADHDPPSPPPHCVRVRAASSTMAAASAMDVRSSSSKAQAQPQPQWVSSSSSSLQDIPADLTIRIADTVFPLHKVIHTLPDLILLHLKQTHVCP